MTISPWVAAFSVATAALLSWSLTLLITRFAKPLKLIADPLGPDQSAHVFPTPTSGGLSIVLTSCLLLAIHIFRSDLTLEQAGLMAVPMTVALLGLLDDRWQLPADWRLLMHFICGVWLLFLLHPVAPDDLTGWIGLLLHLLAFVWMVNLMNFMDGSDGLAASQAVFVLLGLMLLNPGLTWLALPALGACLGFLLLNLPPARIFMGDVGSGFLGALIGLMMIMSILSGELTLASGLILLAVFATDATWTLLLRAARGRKLMKGHREHAYQKAADTAGASRLLTGSQLLNYCWLLPLALAAQRQSEAGIWVTIIAYLPIFILCVCLKGGLSRQTTTVP